MNIITTVSNESNALSGARCTSIVWAEFSDTFGRFVEGKTRETNVENVLSGPFDSFRVLPVSKR